MESRLLEHLPHEDNYQLYRSLLEIAQSNQMQLTVDQQQVQILVLEQYEKHHIMYLFDHYQMNI